MNKQKFIESLRDPSKLKENELEELDNLIKQYPYFQGARVLSAKAAKEKKSKDVNSKIASAAIYVTDRVLLKKYINDHLFYIHSKDRKVDFSQDEVKAKPKRKSPLSRQSPSRVTEPKTSPKDPKQAKSESVKPEKSAKEVKSALKPSSKAETSPPPKTPDYSLDELIEEIYLDIEELKKSKARFDEVGKKLEEEDAVNAAILKASQVKAPEANKEEPTETKVEDAAPTLDKESEDKAVVSREPETQVSPPTQEEKTSEALKSEEKEEKPAKKPKKTPVKKASTSTRKKAETKKTTAKKTTTKASSKSASIKDLKEKALEASKGKEEKASAKAKSEDKIESTEALATDEQEAISNNLPLNADASRTNLSSEESGKEKVEETKPKTKSPAKTKKTSTAKEEKASEDKSAASKEPETKAETKEDVTKETPPQQEKEEESDTLKVVRRRSGKVQSTTYEPKKSQEKDESQLIDDFISKSPSISKPQKDQEKDKKDLADKSSRFQADIGSEYLAEIYVEQGKVDRAISIYEKLCLKFPEKKSFFASRIAELQSEKD